MKKVALVALLILATLFTPGCYYDAPLGYKTDLPLDDSLYGHWRIVSDTGGKQQIIVSRYSDTEYSVRYFSGEEQGLFLRGYPIVVADIPCLQLYVVDEKYELKKDDVNYEVVSYEISGGELLLRILVIDINDLKSSVELRNAFTKNKDDNETFTPKARYIKVSTSESK